MDLNHRRPFGHLIYSQASLTTRTTPPKNKNRLILGGFLNMADAAGLEPATIELTVQGSTN